MVLVALWWGWHDPSRVIPIAVAMLVVSCPCALSLATPVAVAAATTRAMKQGILVTRGHALETLARATHFVFDKTGTLTQGQLSLESVTALGSLTSAQCIELAALLESGSEHPIAQAITRAQGKALVHGGCRNFPGQGVEAEIDGVRWRLGKFDFVQELSFVQSLSVPALNPGETPVWLGNTRGVEARLCFSDTLRPEAESLLQALRRQGIEISLMSGDEPAVVEQLAQRLGISHFEGGMSPQRKLEAIGQLQAEGKVVAMVGDGINDAASLAGAQVSIALGRAADSVQKSADMVILKPSLQPLADAHELSRRMMSIIRQNLAWAFVYNVTAIPLAAMGMVAPWLAGLGMSLSSLLVVLNALQLGSDRKAKIG
jgi:Cu2+-exporting ATPase